MNLSELKKYHDELKKYHISLNDITFEQFCYILGYFGTNELNLRKIKKLSLLVLEENDGTENSTG